MAEEVKAQGKSPLALVKAFFGMNLQQMKDEWTPMPSADKDQIVQGIKDGSLNY